MNCARKHTLVTGCSSGIGRSTALRLARDGQHVYAGIRKPADGDRLARSAAGGEITPVILDVTETGHVAAAAATIDEHTGAGCPRQSSTWPAGASSGCPRRVPSPPDPGGLASNRGAGQPRRYAPRALPAGWPRRRAGRGR
jgi:NAD(P)-dependent dehydrogenase (short-subunit alcohol dehydrogenase family)